MHRGGSNCVFCLCWAWPPPTSLGVGPGVGGLSQTSQPTSQLANRTKQLSQPTTKQQQTNQATEQPAKRTTIQRIEPSANQLSNQRPTKQTTNEPTSQLANQSTNEPTGLANPITRQPRSKGHLWATARLSQTMRQFTNLFGRQIYLRRMTSRNISLRHVFLLYHSVYLLSCVRSYSSISTTCDELKIILCSATCNTTRLLPKPIFDSYAYAYWIGQFDRMQCEKHRAPNHSNSKPTWLTASASMKSATSMRKAPLSEPSKKARAWNRQSPFPSTFTTPMVTFVEACQREGRSTSQVGCECVIIVPARPFMHVWRVLILWDASAAAGLLPMPVVPGSMLWSCKNKQAGVSF